MTGLFLRIFFATLVFFIEVTVHAYVELNTFYYSETFNPGTATTAAKMFNDVSLGFSVDNNSRYLVGWNIGLYSVATRDTYSCTQMGPRFVWGITKSKSVSLGLAYNIVTKASYTPNGGTAEEWNGTAIKADLGYNFPATESWLLGFRLNYSAATYSSKLVNSTTYSTSSNTATYIFPSIYTIYLF